MDTLYFYTGTGNSLWVARMLAEQLGEAHVQPMTRWRRGTVSTTAERVGLVFPVHMWGVPGAVLNFLKRLEIPSQTYVFAVAVNAGQVSRTLLQLQTCCAARGLNLKSGLSIILPSNYIPWGGPGPETQQQLLNDRALQRLNEFASLVRNRESRPVDRGPLWQRMLFTAMYKMAFNHVPGMDRKFWVDERCNGCGLCAKVCPATNILLQDGKPSWQHHCEQCLACLQWCPQEALQYGKNTRRYPRYHHPSVKITDLIQAQESRDS